VIAPVETVWDNAKKGTLQMVPPIDPREFGRLEAEVHSLRQQVANLQDDVRKLLEMANKGKGGLWAGMTIASTLGAIVTWIAAHLGVVGPRA
jgi:uncharacterized protein YlxW (UPF0749 family)